jgi:hypothetical protein
MGWRAIVVQPRQCGGKPAGASPMLRRSRFDDLLSEAAPQHSAKSPANLASFNISKLAGLARPIPVARSSMNWMWASDVATVVQIVMGIGCTLMGPSHIPQPRM